MKSGSNRRRGYTYEEAHLKNVEGFGGQKTEK